MLGFLVTKKVGVEAGRKNKVIIQWPLQLIVFLIVEIYK
jgi:hypothetical protein